VSTLLPPEILGEIFRWNATPDGDFGGLTKGSYNFLLVCHHWFQVASRIPELWSFWGNTMRDWARRHARCWHVPLDLVLDSSWTPFDLGVRLRDVLQDRAARDAIRRVHLSGHNRELMEFTISSIVAPGEDVISNGVESFVIRCDDYWAADVSPFLTRCRLPRLKRLSLSRNCRISFWGHAEITHHGSYRPRANS